MAEIEKVSHAAPETPYDETLQEHREIRRAVQELKDVLSEYRTGMDAKTWRDWKARLSGKLFGLHDRLLAHFREEEHSGLYEALAERLPRIAVRANAVHQEHATILGELADIGSSLTFVEGAISPESKLLARAREVLYLIVRHEQRESDLIARAYLENLEMLD